MKTRHTRHRRGTGIVEVVLSLGLGTLVLGIALSIWTTTARLGSKTDGVADDVTTAAALYSALATDTHRARASSLALAADGRRLDLELTDGSGAVSYLLEADGVRRTADAGPDREYPLPPGSGWALEVIETASPTMPGYLLVTLQVGGDDPGRGLFFEAATPLAEEGGDFPEWNPRP